MEYLDKNLSYFEQNYPKYYKILKEALEEKELSFEHLECVETRDGNQALTITKGERTVRLNSVYRPLQEAKKWADQHEFQNIAVSVLMFGIGNGVFAREMLGRLQEDATVYLYEPDLTVFLYVLHHFDLTDILDDNRVLFFVEDMNAKEFTAEFSKRLHWSSIPTQIPCAHPGYHDLYPEQYDWFMGAVKKEDEREIVNRNTITTMSHSIAANVISNLHFIRESNYCEEFVKDIPKDVPIIIVSAGPSLDKNIEELHRAKGKALIVATDTAVKYLLAKDVPFDAMITIDAKKGMKHMEDKRCFDIPLFTVPEARNAILERHTGRKIWFEGMYYLEKVYMKFHRSFSKYNTGGSVATAAMMLGVSLGFQRYILIGQDLAYGNGATHAGSVVRQIPGEEEGTEMVEGIDGTMVRSRYDWILYRDWFERVIETKKEIEVIDATEGGALIHGSKVMTLSDAIDTYCRTAFDFGKILAEKPYTFTEPEYEEVKKTIFHLDKEFHNIQQKAAEGKKAASDLVAKIHMGKVPPAVEEKCLKTVRKANNFIEKQDVYILFDSYISAKVTDAIQKINCVSGDEQKDMIATLETSKIVFNALIEAEKELRPVLEEVLEKM